MVAFWNVTYKVCHFSFETYTYALLFSLCLLARQIHGNLGSSVAQGSEVIEPEEWHHLVYRYDAQSKDGVLFTD